MAGERRVSTAIETRIAETVARLEEAWTARQMTALVNAGLAAGDSFCTRRTLQRFERREIGLREAVRSLRSRLPGA